MVQAVRFSLLASLEGVLPCPVLQAWRTSPRSGPFSSAARLYRVAAAAALRHGSGSQIAGLRLLNRRVFSGAIRQGRERTVVRFSLLGEISTVVAASTTGESIGDFIKGLRTKVPVEKAGLRTKVPVKCVPKCPWKTSSPHRQASCSTSICKKGFAQLTGLKRTAPCARSVGAKASGATPWSWAGVAPADIA